ncbi:MAG: Gfo/Idh/MocA family oxidoreductase [Phycisphaeraceae bacterium]|nr:Gfo/Idh/MocA family oxidoreductase [Phycisphaeraceae bacterium]
MSDPIRIAFVGAGEVSIQHAQAIRRCGGVELAGLWNRSQDRAELRAKEFGCKTYPTVEAIMADPAIDAVLVLTNLETHYNYAKMALNAGKHVLVEKPVDTCEAHILALRDLAKSKRLVCMPGHNYVYDPGLIRIRRMIDDGALGRVTSVHVLYNIEHVESIAARYPGVIRQIATHHAYILLYLAGKPVRLSAFKATLHYQTLDREDIAMVNLELESGALAHFTASFAADDHTSDPWTVMVKVLGTSGGARYTYRDWVQYQRREAHSQVYAAYPLSIEHEVDHFVNRCIRLGEPPLSTLDDALTASQMVEAMERSAETHTVVEL